MRSNRRLSLYSQPMLFAAAVVFALGGVLSRRCGGRSNPSARGC